MAGVTGETLARMQATAALQRLRSAATAPDALAAMGEIVSQLIGCEEYALFAVEPDRAGLSLVAAVGVEEERLREFSLESGHIGRAASQGRMYIVGPLGAVPGLAQEEHLSACVPLWEGIRVAGVLALFRLLPHKRRLVASDTELLGILSAYGAPTLQGRGTHASALLVPPEPVAGERAAASSLRTIFLHPGELLASIDPAEVSTILGSSVAVCLWDSRQRYWGICHYLLSGTPLGETVSRRLGEVALPALVGEVLRLGSRRQHLQAKVFGGAAVSTEPQPSGADGLGRNNLELARRVLAEAGIPIVAEEVGGTTGRRLRFRTQDGTAWVKPLALSW